jgi:hypothetical protein
MATARHPKATFFVQRQLFSGLTTFAELEQKIAALPDEQSRGAAFEVFAEAYLATQRKHDAAQVWPHGSVPLDLLKNLGLTQQDQGVDGVLQTVLGQFNAYQIKFRSGRPSLTWREFSTFIGLADSPHIHSRVLITNCDELPAVLNDRLHCAEENAAAAPDGSTGRLASRAANARPRFRHHGLRHRQNARGAVGRGKCSAGVLACEFRRRPAASRGTRTGTVLEPAAGDGRATHSHPAALARVAAPDPARMAARNPFAESRLSLRLFRPDREGRH